MLTKNRIGNLLAVAAAVVGLVLVFTQNPASADDDDAPRTGPPPSSQVAPPPGGPVNQAPAPAQQPAPGPAQSSAPAPTQAPSQAPRGGDGDDDGD